MRTFAEGDHVHVYRDSQSTWEVLQVMKLADALYVGRRKPDGGLKDTMLVPMSDCEKADG